jgi:hypothetical protein
MCLANEIPRRRANRGIPGMTWRQDRISRVSVNKPALGTAKLKSSPGDGPFGTNKKERLLPLPSVGWLKITGRRSQRDHPLVYGISWHKLQLIGVPLATECPSRFRLVAAAESTVPVSDVPWQALHSLVLLL